MVFVTSAELNLGDVVTLSPPGYDRPGRVVERYCDNPRFQNHELVGGKIVNTGRGWYDIEVIDENSI